LIRGGQRFAVNKKIIDQTTNLGIRSSNLFRARHFGTRNRRQTPPILRFKPDPIFGTRHRRSSEAMTQELRRLCPLFANRAQERDKQTGLGRTR
jgi:hypothetical protein